MLDVEKYVSLDPALAEEGPLLDLDGQLPGALCLFIESLAHYNLLKHFKRINLLIYFCCFFY